MLEGNKKSSKSMTTTSLSTVPTPLRIQFETHLLKTGKATLEVSTVTSVLVMRVKQPVEN